MPIIKLRPAPPPPVPEEIARWQFFRGLALSKLITTDEALDAVASGVVPPALQALVDGMDDDDAKFDALILLKGALSFRRDHPLVLIFAIRFGWTEEQVDDFWRLCAGLTS